MRSDVVKKIILGISLLGILLGILFAQQQYSAISSVLCDIIRYIKAIATVLAIAMFVVGGILYAIGNILTGSMKQSAHGWAQGLIIGGIIAIVLIIIADPLVKLIASAGNLDVSAIVC